MRRPSIHRPSWAFGRQIPPGAGFAARCVALALPLACSRPGSGTQEPRLEGAVLKMEQSRANAPRQDKRELVTQLEQVLSQQLKQLKASQDEEAPLHYLAFDVTDEATLYMHARRGELFAMERDQQRRADVDLRLGTPKLDNARARRGDYEDRGLGGAFELPLGGPSTALGQALWVATNKQYKAALAAYRSVVASEEQRASHGQKEVMDFAKQGPEQSYASLDPLDLDALQKEWRPKLRELSKLLGDAGCMQGQAAFEVVDRMRSLVASDGARVQRPHQHLRVSMEVATIAADGMRLNASATFEAQSPKELQMSKLLARAKALTTQLAALVKAPLAKPYTGPALLEGRAAAVYFHEIVGHRLEGHRQKSDVEGQTFGSSLSQAVLPSFLSVVDDPRVVRVDGQYLMGHYLYDDEGVKADRVELIKDGRLKSFLLSRSTIAPFTASNGHGRRESGYPVLSRQGNLIVESTRALSQKALRQALIHEIVAQNKPYGLRFVDIDGGYTTTERDGPQAFKVTPKLVYRVYPDGRKDELVRGVDIVGTPLSAFETIIATGDKAQVFNGYCGAESGWVRVSATSPALLLRNIEVERSVHERALPPVMSPPSGNNQPSTNKESTCAKLP